MRLFFVCALALLCGAGFAVEGKGTKSTIQGLPGDVRGVVFSPDSQSVAVSSGQTVKLFDWQKNKEILSVSGGLGATFSPNGQLLAFPGQDEFNNDGLMVWDIATNKKRIFISDDNVISPVFTPSGTMIAAAVGSRIKIYDLATGKAAAMVPSAHKVSITALAYVQDGKRLISTDARGGSALWDTSETMPRKITDFKREGDETTIHALASTRNGPRIAYSTGSGDIVILDSAKLSLLGQFKGFTPPPPKDPPQPPVAIPVKSVAYAPDAVLLASACSGVDDLEIKLWDTQVNKAVFAFTGHTGGINSVAFSPDGKWLASGSDDKTVRIWEVTALIQQSIPPPPKPVKKPE